MVQRYGPSPITKFEIEEWIKNGEEFLKRIDELTKLEKDKERLKDNLEHVREILSEHKKEEVWMFMGIPGSEFTKEDLIKIVGYLWPTIKKDWGGY